MFFVLNRLRKENPVNNLLNPLLVSFDKEINYVSVENSSADIYNAQQTDSGYVKSQSFNPFLGC